MTSEHASFLTNRVKVMEYAIDSIIPIWSILDSSPKTMTHNDCNPRNICIRIPQGSSTYTLHGSGSSNGVEAYSAGTNGGFIPYSDHRTMCLYDWELATIDVPQHDLAEFLAFTLQPSTPLATRLELIEFYRKHLQHYTKMEFPMER